MAKFTKNNLPSNVEKQLQIEMIKEDILSPYYFPPPEDQMRQREVAKMFNTIVQTIINWSTAGKIPSFRIKFQSIPGNFLSTSLETIAIF